MERAFGIHSVERLLREGAVASLTLYTVEAAPGRRLRGLLELAAKRGVAVRRVAPETLASLADGGRHQGVVAEFIANAQGAIDSVDIARSAGAAFLALILDGVQDPHNLGACLRSAAAAGAHAVIVPRDRSCPVTATVRRVACGGAESVPVLRVTNLAREMERLGAAGVWITGADADAEETVYDADLRGPTALVLGGESRGLRTLTRSLCDRVVSIPMNGDMESLNVSVASALCLFEAVRQRRAVSP